MKNGFVKVAAASPVLRVADADWNAGRIIEVIQQAKEQDVRILVFPELCITGYTCEDLHQRTGYPDGDPEEVGFRSFGRAQRRHTGTSCKA